MLGGPIEGARVRGSDGAAVLLGVGWRVDGEVDGEIVTKASEQWGPVESIKP